MPPRYAFWTIILEGAPTAFRARTRAELLPTLRQLRSKHPSAELKWFQRGRLWISPVEARQRRPEPSQDGEKRGPDWRPDGAHRDPRARFKKTRAQKRRLYRERARSGSTAPAKDGSAGPPQAGAARRPPPRPRRGPSGRSGGEGAASSGRDRRRRS